jgi:phospholipid/cholesterol/gamma-HCH transport system substrate-binding protein
LLEETDAAAMNETLERLAAITEGKRDQVASIIDGLNRLTGEVNRRKTETASLLRAANTLSGTLANRDTELAAAVETLNVVVAMLAERRAELVELLRETSAAAAATADLVGDNRGRLDSILLELEQDLAIVGRHQVDLAQSVAYLSVAIEGFSSIGYSAGDFPNEWGNIFTQVLTDPQVDQALGSCGPVDQALDVVLGPDPLACDERDGPNTVPPGAGASQQARIGSKQAPIAGATEFERSMTLFLAPLLQVES